MCLPHVRPWHGFVSAPASRFCRRSMLAMALPALLVLAGGQAELFAQQPAAKAAIVPAGHQVYWLAYSPDGKMVLSVGNSDYVKLWEVALRKERAALRGHNKEVTRVAFCPDGSKWATGSDDTTVVVWDAAKREELFTLKGHTGVVVGVAFAPDGKTLVTGADKTVRVWGLETKKEIAALHLYADVASIAHAPDGKTVAIGTVDGGVSIWDTDEPRKVLPCSTKHTNRVRGLAYSPDSKTLASVSDDGKAVLREVANGKVLADFRPSKGVTKCVAFSRDGKTLALGCEDATMRL